MCQGLAPPRGLSTESSCGFRHCGRVVWWQPASGGPGRASGCDPLSRRLERQPGWQDTAGGHSDQGQSPQHLATSALSKQIRWVLVSTWGHEAQKGPSHSMARDGVEPSVCDEW